MVQLALLTVSGVTGDGVKGASFSGVVSCSVSVVSDCEISGGVCSGDSLCVLFMALNTARVKVASGSENIMKRFERYNL